MKLDACKFGQFSECLLRFGQDLSVAYQSDLARVLAGQLETGLGRLAPLLDCITGMPVFQTMLSGRRVPRNRITDDRDQLAVRVVAQKSGA